jgi:hypothetical protein
MASRLRSAPDLQKIMGSENRKKTKLIAVRATPVEKEYMKKRAEAFGISVGALCRHIIFESRVPQGIMDQSAIGELAKTRADLGRVGGLLKGWLAGSFENSAGLPLKGDIPTIRSLLQQIEKTQALISDQIADVFNKPNDR